jgi:hypothetical protein
VFSLPLVTFVHRPEQVLGDMHVQYGPDEVGRYAFLVVAAHESQLRTSLVGKRPKRARAAEGLGDVVVLGPK